MDDQFDDFSVPNPETKYYCDKYITSQGFTHLMKLIMMVKKTPEVINMIKQIIENNPEEISKKNKNGWNALMFSCLHGNSEIVEMLLNSKNINLDINLKNNSGDAALMLVHKNTGAVDRLEIVKLLINTGADVNLRNSNNATVLFAVCELCNTNYDVQIIKLLIKAGADVNLQIYYGYSALMLACWFSNTTSSIEIVKILLEAGSNVNAQNLENYTALKYACQFSNTSSSIETVKLLLKYKANFDHSDKYSKSALILACQFSNTTSSTETVNILLEANANINLICGFNNTTALLSACKNVDNTSNIETVKILLNASADVNYQDCYGHTALMQMLQSNSVDRYSDVVTQLIMISAKNNCIMLKNGVGKTAYDIYVEKGLTILNDYMVKILDGTNVINCTKSAKY